MYLLQHVLVFSKKKFVTKREITISYSEITWHIQVYFFLILLQKYSKFYGGGNDIRILQK